ncbi:MAG: hypothetical protein WCJ02_04855 [bacterium]
MKQRTFLKLGGLGLLALTLLNSGCITGRAVKDSYDYSTIPFEAKLNNRIVQLPASGKFVLESHLATTADLFPSDGNTTKPRLFPKITFAIGKRKIGSDEGIKQHLDREWIEYKKSFPMVSFAELFDNTYVKQWTPAEGGKPGQGSVGNTRPSVAEEIWIANMFWASKAKPKPGTKFLMTAHGKRVVVVMGYETGPEGHKFLGGAQGAVFKALGMQNNDVAEIACLKDQSVPIGPVITQ